MEIGDWGLGIGGIGGIGSVGGIGGVGGIGSVGNKQRWYYQHLLSLIPLVPRFLLVSQPTLVLSPQLPSYPVPSPQLLLAYSLLSRENRQRTNQFQSKLVQNQWWLKLPQGVCGIQSKGDRAS